LAVNGTDTRGNSTRDRCVVATVPIIVVGYGAEPAGGRWWREPDLLGRRPHEQLPCHLQVRLGGDPRDPTLCCGRVLTSARQQSNPLLPRRLHMERGGVVGWGGKWSGEVRDVLAHNLGLPPSPGLSPPRPHLTGTGLAPCHICTGTELAPCHICPGTGTQMRDGPASAAVLVQVGRRAHARADRRDRPVERARVRQPRGHGAAALCEYRVEYR
jgi:hypothetical protein